MGERIKGKWGREVLIRRVELFLDIFRSNFLSIFEFLEKDLVIVSISWLF